MAYKLIDPDTKEIIAERETWKEILNVPLPEFKSYIINADNGKYCNNDN